MRTLDAMSKQQKLKIASETLYLYAPLAHRLGLYSIKTELEDLGLKFTKPEIYKAISLKLNETKLSRNKYISKFSQPIKTVLKKEGLKTTIKGRPKSIYSIREKILYKGVTFDNIFDKFAIRIIVDSNNQNEKSDCWKIYSIVTDFYKPNPDRLRDWISTPKVNGYESLHTTVMGEDGDGSKYKLEVKMDEIAEKICSTWHYKIREINNLDMWINKISSLLENPESNAIDFIDDFKLNLYSGEIFVFTPKGDLKTLRKGATALDFAFEIHTQIGMTCLGVKVNGKLVALSHILSSGDQVEIITSKKQYPRKDWLRFVVTSHARTRIKSALKREEKIIAEKGKELAERKLRHLRTKLSRDTENQLVKFFKSSSSQELYFRFGNGQISNQELKEFVNLKNSGWYQTIKNKIYKSRYLSKIPIKNNLIVFNEDDEILEYKISKCCNAIPGDNIFGFLSIVDGLKVHREDCPNAIELRANYAYRILKAKWTTKENLDFTANLKLSGIDSVGLVNKVTQIISKQLHVDIKAINIYTHDGVFEGEITLKVHNETFLSEITKKLEKIEGIVKISRTYKHSKNIKV